MSANIGVIIRDHEGKLVDGVNEVINADCPIVAEALAVNEGVKRTVTKGYSKVVIESDSANLCTDVVGSGQARNGKYGPLSRKSEKSLNKSLTADFTISEEMLTRQ
ncbi:hypothetical protein DITRI_Ditri05aG0153000 [Diplodiscus trichospermus]